jgi:hypothetical protein
MNHFCLEVLFNLCNGNGTHTRRTCFHNTSVEPVGTLLELFLTSFFGSLVVSSCAATHSLGCDPVARSSTDPIVHIKPAHTAEILHLLRGEKVLLCVNPELLTFVNKCSRIG